MSKDNKKVLNLIVYEPSVISADHAKAYMVEKFGEAAMTWPLVTRSEMMMGAFFGILSPELAEYMDREFPKGWEGSTNVHMLCGNEAKEYVRKDVDVAALKARMNADRPELN